MRTKERIMGGVIAVFLTITLLPSPTALASEAGRNNNTNLTIPTQLNVTQSLTPSNSFGKIPNSTYQLLWPTIKKELEEFAAHSVQAVSAVGVSSSVVASPDLNAPNPLSQTSPRGPEGMGVYLNNGRRADDHSIYNPKYDIRIDSTNQSAITNQINPTSIAKEKGALYYNDGTQYGFRSVYKPDYDIRKTVTAAASSGSNQISNSAPSLSSPVAASAPVVSNQINNPVFSLNSPMGPYYNNNGTRYSDSSIHLTDLKNLAHQKSVAK